MDVVTAGSSSSVLNMGGLLMSWIIPEDVCNGTPGAVDWSELLYILGPIGVLVLLLVCVERAVAWRRRKLAHPETDDEMEG